jgi:hypothetical protein
VPPRSSFWRIMRPQPAVGADATRARSGFTAGLALATFTPLVLAPLLAPRDSRGTAEALGVLLAVAYAGHIAVTGWLWTLPDVREMVRTNRWRMTVLPVILVALGAIVGLTMARDILDWLLLGFFAWQFTHFQRQNLGLVTLIGAKWSAEPLTVTERRLIAIAGWCGTAGLLARPTLLGLPNASLTPLVENAVTPLALAGLGACTIGAVIASLRSRRPTPVICAYLTAVLFFAPVFLFTTPAAAVTGLVIAHGLQYICVVGWRSHTVNGGGHREGLRIAVAILVLAVVGGALLEAMSELQSGQASGIRMLYGVYFGLVMAHFAFDAVVWRKPARLRAGSARPQALLPRLAEGRL